MSVRSTTIGRRDAVPNALTERRPSSSRSSRRSVRAQFLLPRIVAAGEALDYGDVEEARAIIGDLEQEIGVAAGADRRPFACDKCGLTFRWPGELDHHRYVSAHGLPDAEGPVAT